MTLMSSGAGAATQEEQAWHGVMGSRSTQDRRGLALRVALADQLGRAGAGARFIPGEVRLWETPD